MNAPALTTATETQRIELALDVLVGAAIKADALPPIRPHPGPRPASESVQEVLDRLDNWTDAQRVVADMLDRPVSSALKAAIRAFGARLSEVGGHSLMLDVCESVAAMDPENQGRRLSIIDHLWDGIGGWAS